MPFVAIDRVTQAIKAGAEELFSRQRADGAFTDDPPPSVIGTAGSITALHAAGLPESAELVATGAAWLRQSQLPDGGWGGVTGAESGAVPTAVATAALRITARDTSAEAVAAGLRRLAELGGVQAVPDPAIAHLCGQFLALAGLADPASLRRLPLAVVLADRIRRQRISFRTAPFIGLALLQAATDPPHGPGGAAARLAQPAALRLLRAVDDHEGHTGAFSEDPWPAALVCLGLARAGLAPDLVASIAGFLHRVMRADGSWDAVANLDLTRSAFAATGLIAAGYAGTPQLGLTRELFHRCQQRNAFTVLGCPAGGWSYSGPDGWPVTLESAEILSALARLPGHETDPVLRTGIAWLIGRQDRRGSWSLWVRDTKLPNDGPCPGITAQGIVALLDAGHSPGSRPVTAAVRWLLSEARPDGTFENLWYRDFTSGTAMALDALCQAGQAEQPACHGARDWLIAAQRADGSWGDGTASCPGSVEETAWALPALLAAGVPPSSAAVQRGIEWLLQAQQPDGSWQPSRVCAYIRHVMHYPNGAITRGHALRALAAYRDAMRSDGTAAGAR